MRRRGRGFFSSISWQCGREYASGFLLLFPGMCTAAGALGIQNVRVTKAFAGPSCCSRCFKYFYTWGSQEYSLAFLLFMTGVTELEHSELCPELLGVLWLPCSLQRVPCSPPAPHTDAGCPHSSAAAGAALGTGRGGSRSHPSVNPALAHRHCPTFCQHAAAPEVMAQEMGSWLRAPAALPLIHAGRDTLSLAAGTGAAPEAVFGPVHCSHLNTGCQGAAAAQLLDFC